MHRYKSARRLATALQFVHPSAELRQEVQLFRALELNPGAEFVSSVPSSTKRRPDRSTESSLERPSRRHFHSAEHCGVSVGDFLWRFRQFYDVAPARCSRALPGCLVRRVLAPCDRALSACRSFPSLLQSFCALCARPGVGENIGSIRFAAGYLISGLGSSIGVVALWEVHLTNPGQVVGASGCIMGIVGAWAGYLLRHRHAPRAKERLLNVLLIIAIQTAFDFTTPQVSTAAHVCGLLTGFIFGLIISPRESRTIFPSG